MTKHEDCIHSVYPEWAKYLDSQMKAHYKQMMQCKIAEMFKDLTIDQLLDRFSDFVNITRTEDQELYYQAIKIELNKRHGKSN